MKELYRIREAIVECCNGYSSSRERRFIAEKRMTFLGILKFWWPLANAQWRWSEQDCRNDLDAHIALTKPLKAPQYIIVETE